MVIVLFSLCGCQRPEPQRHQSTFERLVHGGCAYSEVSVAERDELSKAIPWSIHHWIWGHGLESTDGGPLLTSQAPLIWSCGCTSYGDTCQNETRLAPATRAFSSPPGIIPEAEASNNYPFCLLLQQVLATRRNHKEQICAWATVSSRRVLSQK